MFLEAPSGVRHLWPVIFLLPWFIIGAAFLVESILHRLTRTGSERVRMRAHSRVPWLPVGRLRR